MTATSISRAVRAPIHNPASFTERVAARLRAMRQRRFERRAIADLRGLSPHTLKDIGLHCSEITSVVRVKQSDRRRRYAGH